MRATVITYGTEGDARPLAFLCRALMDAGHEAHLLADASTLGAAHALGVPSTALAGDIRGTLNPEQGIATVIRNSGNVSRSARALADIANANATPWLRAAVDAAHDADVLLAGGLAGFVGLCAAEYLRIPAIGLGMIPITPTRTFPSPLLPPRRVPAWLNYASQELVNQLLWRAFRGAINRARATVCRLPPQRSLWRGHAMLYGISPSICPKPSDWPANARMCGQWVEPMAEWRPPVELAAFLEAGEAPLYIGFGSMSGFDVSKIGHAIVEAAAGRRALLSPGWSGLDRLSLPQNFHVLHGDTPHDWLFPRVAVAVHHGGSGTTHSACRAGVPSVVLPFAGDQFFWADRLVRLGVSPERLDGRAVEAARLRKAIDAAQQPVMRARAGEIARRMHEEDGLAAAVAAVEERVATQ